MHARKFAKKAVRDVTSATCAVSVHSTTTTPASALSTTTIPKHAQKPARNLAAKFAIHNVAIRELVVQEATVMAATEEQTPLLSVSNKRLENVASPAGGKWIRVPAYHSATLTGQLKF